MIFIILLMLSQLLTVSHSQLVTFIYRGTIFICKVNLKAMSFWNIEPDGWFSRARKLLPLLDREIRPAFFDEVLTGFSKMEDELGHLESQAPKELITEHENWDGTKVRRIGPIVYGYTMTVGPDGKPVVREFGNVKRDHKHGLSADIKPARPEIGEEREPMIDVLATETNVKVTVEMPGVEKDKIKIDAYDNTVQVRSLDPTRKYHKVIDLPTEADVKTARSKYNNGILEITFDKKKETKPKGKQIKIE